MGVYCVAITATATTTPPPVLSARQRDAQREAMIHQINATTRQVNVLTKAVDSLTTQQGATVDSLAEFCGRSFWQRLRWLVTGQ